MRATIEVWRLLEQAYQECQPDKLRGLNKPITPQELTEAQKKIGIRYPQEFLELVKIHNGSDNDASFFGAWNFEDVKSLAGTWEFLNDNLEDSWGDFTEEDHQKVQAGPGVKKLWYNKRWIPVLNNSSGDSVCIDYDPAPGGKLGQVIIFWHDDNERKVVAPTFYDFFRTMCEQWIVELKKEHEKKHPQKVEQAPAKKPGWLSWGKPKPAQEGLFGFGYSPIRSIWKRVEDHYKSVNPVALKSLKSGVGGADIYKASNELGVKLPAQYIELLKIHNGCNDTIKDGHRTIVNKDIVKFGIWQFISLESVVRSWQTMVELQEEGYFKSSKPECEEGIKNEWWNAKWIPIFEDYHNNSICIDYDPAPGGTIGQLIHWHASTASRTIVSKDFITGFDKIVSKMLGDTLASHSSKETK